MSSIGHMIEVVNTFCVMARAHDRARPGMSSFQSQILFFVKRLEGSMEAEAEAVDGRIKEAEAKKKLTAVTSLVFFHPFTQVLQWRSCRPLVLFANQSE